ncbi:MAG: class I SAM-dependent methyltransferase [Promethearchaeia archaeon]
MRFKKSYIIHSQLTLPFLETPEEDLKEILNTLESKFNLKKNSNQKFIDLGAGNGSVIIFVSLNYGIKATGLEIDPILVEEAREKIKMIKNKDKRLKKLIKKAKIYNRDIYYANLKKYDFIYLFGLPIMHPLLKHVIKTAKKGAILIFYKYECNNLDELVKFINKIKHNNGENKRYSYFYKKK